jgi:hypothetical protein
MIAFLELIYIVVEDDVLKLTFYITVEAVNIEKRLVENVSLKRESIVDELKDLGLIVNALIHEVHL